MSRASIAQGILKAKMRGGGVYVNPGRGEVTILDAKMIDTSESGAVFSSNFIFDKCEPFNGLKDEANNPKAAGNPVGSVASITCCIEDGDKYKREYAFEDVTKYLTAVLDENAETVVSNLNGLLGLNAEGLTDDSLPQPMRGMRVAYTTQEKDTNPKDKSKTAKRITKIVWTHIPQTQEEINARCAELDKAGKAVG